MADFAAVIRRTVDGLSDNVPEMRAKVYDKARGAVRRQLESMKPQPSEDMINRQMAKLELAIAEVESDNAEALPPAEEPPVLAEEPAYEEPAYEAPAAVEEPPVAAPPEAVEAQDEPVHVEPADEAPVDAVPAAEPVQEEALVAPEATADSAPETWPADPAAADVIAVTEAEDTENRAADELHSDPIWEAAAPAAHDTAEPFADDYRAVEVEPPVAEHDDIVHVPDQDGEQAEVAHTHADYDHDDRAAEIPAWGHAEVEVEPAPAPAAVASEWELPEWNDPAPASAEAETAWAERELTVGHAEEAVEVAVERVAELARETDGVTPAAPVDPTHSWAWEDDDPFAQVIAPPAAASVEPEVSDWSWPVEKSAAADGDAANGERKSSSWDEIDDLLNGAGSVSAAAATADLAPARVADPQPLDGVGLQSRPVSYRVEPKRSALNAKTIGLAAALLLVLGGGGFAYWQNQDSVNGWVSGMLTSETAPAPAEKSLDASGSGKAETTPAADTAAPAGQEIAALDTAAPTKFTQRLQVDGSEVDEGPAAAAAGESAQQEGKSVAAQTEAGQPADTAVSAQTPPTTTTEAQPAQDTTPAADTAQPQAVPAGAQKMFLYEERLGQSAPTAIEGNVAWSVKEESPGGDAKPEPVIEAQINVPERGLTALVTIKRNADASLPASHVIEFVFSLPETFEGGSIDSVQRVAMKRNEQDRGRCADRGSGKDHGRFSHDRAQ